MAHAVERVTPGGAALSPRTVFTPLTCQAMSLVAVGSCACRRASPCDPRHAMERAAFRLERPPLKGARSPALRSSTPSRWQTRRSTSRTAAPRSRRARPAVLAAVTGPTRRARSLSWSVSYLPYTAIHPVKQSGKTLLAPKGTNTWLVAALAATECAVAAGWGWRSGAASARQCCSIPGSAPALGPR